MYYQEQLPVCVMLTPTVEVVYQDALDIFDKTHSKKYRVSSHTNPTCTHVPELLIFPH